MEYNSKYNNNAIGKRVRETREYYGYSREKLAELVDLSPQFLAEVETGKKGSSSNTLYKLCKGLNVSADYLLTGKTNKGDYSKIIDMLSTLDEKYIPLVEQLIKTFIDGINK